MEVLESVKPVGHLTMFKRFKRLVAILFIIPLLFSTFAVFAQDDLQSEFDKKQEELQQIEARKKELQDKIAQAQYQEATLANQISYLNNTIYLTELEISETQGEIITTQDQLIALGENIEKLTEKLANLEDSIGALTRALQARIREAYKLSRTTTSWEFFISSETVDSFIRRYAYISTLQYEDRKLMQQMVDSQDIFSEQRDRLEELKQEKEELKKQLEDQKAVLGQQQAGLSQQKANKQYILQVTENEEARYQELLSSLQRDEAAIREAINGLLRQIAGNVLEGTAVKRGDVIGLVGNTGAVYPRPTVDNPYAGAHVHFSVFTCDNCPCATNLWSCTTNPRSHINNGTLRWPLDDFYISQEYGYTWFAASSGYYSDSFHNGIDLVSNDGYGAAVRAGADGTVYYTVDGWGGHGALIKHSDNLFTAYWHIQPVQQ